MFLTDQVTAWTKRFYDSLRCVFSKPLLKLSYCHNVDTDAGTPGNVSPHVCL